MQNMLTNLFNVNDLNELTSVGRSGTFTVAGGRGELESRLCIIHSERANRRWREAREVYSEAARLPGALGPPDPMYSACPEPNPLRRFNQSNY